MRLSDVMSAMDLATFPQVALVLFLGVFVVVVVRVYVRGRAADFEGVSRLPFDDDGAAEPSPRPTAGPDFPA